MIVYIGSEAGWQGEASASSYCISKFALEGMASLPSMSIHC